MNSVIIPNDIKELLLEDAKDFMDSEEWYGERGIPWQRGWLFYGAPGSGKVRQAQHDLTIFATLQRSLTLDFDDPSTRGRARFADLCRHSIEEGDGRHCSWHIDKRNSTPFHHLNGRH